MDINDFQIASQKLKWTNTAYQLWITDNQFLFELKLSLNLDHQCRFIIDILKAPEIKTSNSLTENILHVIYDDKNGKRRKIALYYSKIEELYNEMDQVVFDDLKERIN